jgi:hypothetical protein
MMNPADLAKKVGGKVLYVGVEAYGWTLADYTAAAKNARALGFDSICVKVADGANRWYANVNALRANRETVLAQGCGFLGFIYCYGPKFGNGQIALEADVAKEIASVCDGVAVLDIEVEWNGQTEAAALFATYFSGVAINLIVTTWADPAYQNFTGVIKALDPVVAAWNPQEYTTWLSLQETEFKDDNVALTKIFPALDIADMYSGNNPLQVLENAINNGHPSVWVWEYGATLSISAYVKSVLSLLVKKPLAVKPTVVPASAPTAKVEAHPVASNPNVAPVTIPAPNLTIKYGTYKVADGDSLTTIAYRLGIKNWYQDLFLLNKTVLDQAAQGHGAANSNNGSLIYADTILKYPLL